jgi:recombination protein RecA
MNPENDEKFQKFLEGLDPVTAKEVKTAAKVRTVRYPLASEGLTRALDGGIGAGRITLCYGNQSSGKTLLFLQSIAKWQKMGLVCCWVDVEGVYEKEWAERLGVDNEKLILIRSKSAGRIEKDIKPLLKNKIDIVVIDSISDIMAEVFVDKHGELNAYEDRKQVGAQAKAITTLINGILYLNDETAVVLISQTTTEFGQTYVKQIPHGGKKTLFASSQIIKLTSSGTEGQQIKGDVQVGDVIVTKPIGRKVNAMVEKNKLGAQSDSVDYDIYYKGPFVGVDYHGEVADFAEVLQVIRKSGAWFKHDSTGQQWQGRDNLIKALRNDEELFSLIKKEIHLKTTGEIIE